MAQVDEDKTSYRVIEEERQIKDALARCFITTSAVFLPTRVNDRKRVGEK